MKTAPYSTETNGSGFSRREVLQFLGFGFASLAFPRIPYNARGDSTPTVTNEVLIPNYSRDLLESELNSRLQLLSSSNSHIHNFHAQSIIDNAKVVADTSSSSINLDELPNKNYLAYVQKSEESPKDQITEIKDLISVSDGMYPGADVSVVIRRNGNFVYLQNIDELDTTEREIFEQLSLATKHGTRVYQTEMRLLKELGYPPSFAYMPGAKTISFIIDPMAPEEARYNRTVFYEDPPGSNNIVAIEMYMSTKDGAMAEIPHLVFPSILTRKPRIVSTNIGATLAVIIEGDSNAFDINLRGKSNFKVSEQGSPLRMGLISSLLQDQIRGMTNNEYQQTIELLSILFSQGVKDIYPEINYLSDPNATIQQLDVAIRAVLATRLLLPIENELITNDQLSDLQKRLPTLTALVNWLRQPNSDFITNYPVDSIGKSCVEALAVIYDDSENNEYTSNFGQLILTEGLVQRDSDGVLSYDGNFIDDISHWDFSIKGYLLNPGTNQYEYFDVSQYALVATTNSTFSFTLPKTARVGDENQPLQNLGELQVSMFNSVTQQLVIRRFYFPH